MIAVNEGQTDGVTVNVPHGSSDAAVIGKTEQDFARNDQMRRLGHRNSGTVAGEIDHCAGKLAI